MSSERPIERQIRMRRSSDRAAVLLADDRYRARPSPAKRSQQIGDRHVQNHFARDAFVAAQFDRPGRRSGPRNDAAPACPGCAGRLPVRKRRASTHMCAGDNITMVPC